MRVHMVGDQKTSLGAFSLPHPFCGFWGLNSDFRVCTASTFYPLNHLCSNCFNLKCPPKTMWLMFLGDSRVLKWQGLVRELAWWQCFCEGNFRILVSTLLTSLYLGEKQTRKQMHRQDTAFITVPLKTPLLLSPSLAQSQSIAIDKIDIFQLVQNINEHILIISIIDNYNCG